MLKYFNEVWTSDNTEALSRARIQYGTSLFYPASVMGSHVSATPNHQTQNVTPIKFRFDMACAGRLGMELQPRQMTDAEREFARMAIASYKTYREIVSGGDLYRIGTPYDDTEIGNMACFLEDLSEFAEYKFGKSIHKLKCTQVDSSFLDAYKIHLASRSLAVQDGRIYASFITLHQIFIIADIFEITDLDLSMFEQWMGKNFAEFDKDPSIN